MTREEFIKELKYRGYSYEIVGDKLVVTHSGHVGLDSLETIPSGVEFKNGGSVWLGSLVTLPSGVEFKNRGDVDLSSLVTLPSGVEFKNGGDVYLSSLIGGMFSEWKGNIEGIGNKTLLNIMIKRGVFE